MMKRKKYLFDINPATGDITLNPGHKRNIRRLLRHIKQNLSGFTGDSITIYYQTYRLYDDVIIHALDFISSFNDAGYTLTLTEGKNICFYPHSFSSRQGAVTVTDAVDVNGFIHYLCCELKTGNIPFDFSFFNKYP